MQNMNNLSRGARGRPDLVRVAVVAPTLDILGGQAVQADRLLRSLESTPDIRAELLPINPRLPGALRWLQEIKYVRTLVTSVAYAWRLLRTIPNVEVVHIFSASYFSFVIAPTPALWASRLLGKPTVLNYHSGEAEDHLERWRRTAIPTLRMADRIVVPSEYLIEVFSQFNLPAQAIPNSLDLDQFRFRLRSDLKPVFLSNRNLEVHYGVDVVLEAFALIQKQVSDAVLLIAGYGSQEEPLRSMSETLGCMNVQFLGRVSTARMIDLYDDADVFLNASAIDNMPLSILEAHASGLPVVTSDAGGIPYIVEHESTALVVPVRRPSELASQALKLLGDPALARRLSAQGRASVEERYTMEGVMPSWVDLYHDLASKTRIVD